jgi:hypothetical protein
MADSHIGEQVTEVGRSSMRTGIRRKYDRLANKYSLPARALRGEGGWESPTTVRHLVASAEFSAVHGALQEI